MEFSSKIEKRERFEEYSMPYLNILYGTALRMTKNRTDAEDLIQETYLKAFRAFSQFEEGTNFKAWIFKILTNTYINRFKKDKKSPEQVSVDDMADTLIYDRVTSLQTGSTDNPERIFLKKFIPDEIKRAVENLQDEYRMTFILSDVHGFTNDEIAGIMEVSVGTVKSRLFRARRLLQQALV
ncbi:MAG TPA: sigma-70 family RNA polymerase sigma factor [bacterium]|nr:sigma-70 family RNA polymerase sigma factor [bacterium]